jgi:hypothetical protein
MCRCCAVSILEAERAEKSGLLALVPQALLQSVRWRQAKAQGQLLRMRVLHTTGQYAEPRQVGHALLLRSPRIRAVMQNQVLAPAAPVAQCCYSLRVRLAVCEEAEQVAEASCCCLCHWGCRCGRYAGVAVQIRSPAAAGCMLLQLIRVPLAPGHCAGGAGAERGFRTCGCRAASLLHLMRCAAGAATAVGTLNNAGDYLRIGCCCNHCARGGGAKPRCTCVS